MVKIRKAPRVSEKKPEKTGLVGYVRNILRILTGKHQVVIPPIITVEEIATSSTKKLIQSKKEKSDKPNETEPGNIINISEVRQKANDKAHQKYMRKKARRAARDAAQKQREPEVQASEEPQEAFEELLEESLSVANIQTAIREKAQGSRIKKPQKRRLTAKQQLKNIENREDIPTFDLHKMTKKEAKRKLMDLIGEYRKSNERFLCIITGKGNRSINGTPILRPMVEKSLQECMDFGEIESFEDAPPKLGGKGAFVVILK